MLLKLLKIIILILIINPNTNSYFINDDETDNLKERFNKLRSNHLLNKNGAKENFRRQQPWKDDWRQKWEHVKQLVTKYNSTKTDLGGDRVNMIAARPWGVPCGDPNQHDLPWGTCTLPMECESEFRIFRGDYFCGNSEFVCCGILLNSYDMFHGLVDASLSDTSMQTDSDEIRVEINQSTTKSPLSNAKRRRRELRERRQRLIQNLIRDTVTDISRLLNKTYRFGNRVKKRRVQQLKEFIQYLKRMYQKDRQSVQDIHQLGLHKVDSEIYKGISAIRILNHDLVYNNTIHKWVVCGTLSRKEKELLRKKYPFAADHLFEDKEAEKTETKTRRNDIKNRMFDYEIEYGVLYKRKEPIKQILYD